MIRRWTFLNFIRQKYKFKNINMVIKYLYYNFILFKSLFFKKKNYINRIFWKKLILYSNIYIYNILLKKWVYGFFLKKRYIKFKLSFLVTKIIFYKTILLIQKKIKIYNIYKSINKIYFISNSNIIILNNVVGYLLDINFNFIFNQQNIKFFNTTLFILMLIKFFLIFLNKINVCLFLIK